MERTITLAKEKRWEMVAMALAVALVSYVYVTQSAPSNIPDHGDWWTDMAHITVGRNLNLYGFAASRFGAVTDNGTEVGLPPAYYTHWPPFPALILGLLYRLGLSTAEARILPLLVSSSAIVAIYLLARRVLGDWRIGIIASLALAASAPFRLLSDAFSYLSYDFAAIAWTMLFITLGSLASGRRRLAWMLAAGAGSFATIGLSGFEMVPAMLAYGVLFPSLFASPSWKERGRVASISGLCIAAGLLAGLAFRLGHNYLLLGGLDAVIEDFRVAFFYRTSSAFEFTWEEKSLFGHTDDQFLYYSGVLLYRALAYFPLHLAVIVVALGIGGLLALFLVVDVDWRPFQWLGIIFISEMLWFVFFRQHTHMHVHTIYHLSLSMSVGVAISAGVAWRIIRGWRLGSAATVVVGLALFIGSLANVGVQPYGNLQIRVDWTARQQEIEELASLLPLNAVAVLELGNMDPTTEFFLGRSFVRRWSGNRPVDLQGRPLFLITQPNRDSATYKDALKSGRLMKETKDLALFEMSANVLPAHAGTGGTGNP